MPVNETNPPLLPLRSLESSESFPEGAVGNTLSPLGLLRIMASCWAGSLSRLGTFLKYLFLFLTPQTEALSLSKFSPSHLNLPPVPIVTFLEALLVLRTLSRGWTSSRGPGLGGEVWCAVSQEGASQGGRPSGLVPPRGGQAEPPSWTVVPSCAREFWPSPAFLRGRISWPLAHLLDLSSSSFSTVSHPFPSCCSDTKPVSEHPGAFENGHLCQPAGFLSACQHPPLLPSAASV